MAHTRLSALTLFLGRIMARSRLTDAEQQAILDLPGRLEEVRNNQDLIKLGEVVDHTCLVVDGLMGRFGQTRDGHRQISALYIPGDMPDLYSFVIPRSSWALMGLTKSVVLRIPHTSIRDITERYPAVARAFWRDCTLDAAVTAEWILNIGRRTARARIAHLLCEMAMRYEQIGRFVGLSFTFPINQNHLADATGLTPVHVNRMLAGLKRAEIVSLTSRVVHVLDWGALATTADFDPGYLQLDNALAPSGLIATLRPAP